MNSEELGILLGGLGGIIASLLYAFKNIKESSCCGSRCKQVVIDSNGNAIKSSICDLNERDLELATFPQQRVAII
jgi:hypothetical protein